jgi:hypothetical protein
MRLLIFLTSVSLLCSGCATVAPVSYQERCAAKGLTLSGVSSGSSQAIASGTRGGVVTVNGYSENVHCEVPKTEPEKCETNRLAKMAEPKLNYNRNLYLRNMGIMVGYIFYVVPGVGLKLWADKDYDSAMAETKKIEQGSVNSCAAETKQDVAESK